MDLVEAQIAEGLVTRLCRCTRPPIPMVRVRVQRYQGRRGNMLRRYVFQRLRCEKTLFRVSDRHGILGSSITAGSCRCSLPLRERAVSQIGSCCPTRKLKPQGRLSSSSLLRCSSLRLAVRASVCVLAAAVPSRAHLEQCRRTTCWPRCAGLDVYPLLPRDSAVAGTIVFAPGKLPERFPRRGSALPALPPLCFVAA
jgi:hypothetical protein